MKHKFNAVRCEKDGIKFPSKLEAAYYSHLKNQKEGLLFFLRQVGIDLPGKTSYRVDFVEFWANGEVIFTEVKGKDTPMSILKRKQVEDLYPIKINVVKKLPISH